MKKYKVLVVDDEPNFCQAMALQLKMRGYETITAADGFEGFQIAVREKPDLILADVMMPIIDGYEFCAQIKAHPELKDIPVIFVTAKADRQSLAKGYSVGGARYLTKPPDNKELFKAVDLRLKDSDKLKALYAHKARRFCGDLKVISLYNLLDMFSLNRWNGSIEIKRTLDFGRIEIAGGEIVRCVVNGRQDPDGLFTVFGWPDGEFVAERI